MRFLRLNVKSFKHIPKWNICMSLFLLAGVLCSLFCILQPQEILLQKTQEATLKIDTIALVGYKSRGSQQYAITAGGQSYYFVYYYSDAEVNGEYKMFREFLENHTNKDSIIITAKVSSKQTLSDVIYNRHRILCFSSDGTEYLSMHSTEKYIESLDRGAWVGFALFGVFFFVHALFNIIVYGKIEQRRKKKGSNA